MMKNKVLFVLHNLSNAGVERICLNLLNYLKDEYKIYVYLYAFDGGNKLDETLPTGIVYFKYNFSNNCKFIRFIKSTYFLASIIHNRKPAICMGFSLYDNFLLSMLKCFLKFKYIASQHSEVKGELFRYKDKINCLRRIQAGIIYKNADKFIVISEGIKNQLLTRDRKLKSKLVVIKNGIDISYIQVKLEEDLDADWGKYFIFVGRLEFEKSINTLIKAFSIIQHERKELNLLILGEGSQKNNLINLADKLNCKSRVHFLGFQSNPFKYMKKAIALVLPSLYEGFGCVILEAMACNIPVIASAVIGPKEIIRDKENGLLFLPADYLKLVNAMRLIENDKVLRGNIIMKSQNELGKYTHMGQDYSNLFNCVTLKE